MRIPKGIPKRFHQFIEDVDRDPEAPGEYIITLRGMAFEDANRADPCHVRAGTGKELGDRLKWCARCTCTQCLTTAPQ